MRETRADTNRAFALALALHALLFAFLFVGMWWTRDAATASAGGAMAADVVDVGELSASMQQALNADPAPEALPESEEEPLPEPEPVPEEVAPQPTPQELLPEPDTENQEAVIEAPTPRPTTETKPQEAKQRQEQVDLTEERKRQEQAEQRRLDAEKLETERRIAEIRRKRAAASREAQLAEQRLQQLQDARSGSGRAAEEAARADAAASAPGGGGDDAGLRARYAEALKAAITSKWTRPDAVQSGDACRLVIRQLPGGEVVDVQVASPCSYDEAGRRSIEAAVLKAQPLPYAGFESVFQRNLTLNFRAD